MKCPNCGNKLTLMAAEDVTRLTIGSDTEDVRLEVLFNCEECTHDWRTEVDLPYDQTLYPQFWG